MNKEDVLIVVCQHGNEPFGLEIKKQLEGEYSFLVAHEKALEASKRFIETDLNRSFPGKKDGSLEEQLAYAIVPKLQQYKLVIDIHSTTSKTPLFAITTNLTNEIKSITKKMGVTKLVCMPESFGKKKALIDYAPLGISLEVGPHKRLENVIEVIEAINNLFTESKESSLEIYDVFDTIKGEGASIVKNFKEVKKGDFVSENTKAPYDFYPIMAGEASYKGILTLAAKKLIE